MHPSLASFKKLSLSYCTLKCLFGERNSYLLDEHLFGKELLENRCHVRDVSVKLKIFREIKWIALVLCSPEGQDPLLGKYFGIRSTKSVR
jgi:hypothetical protein